MLPTLSKSRDREYQRPRSRSRSCSRSRSRSNEKRGRTFNRPRDQTQEIQNFIEHKLEWFENQEHTCKSMVHEVVLRRMKTAPDEQEIEEIVKSMYGINLSENGKITIDASIQSIKDKMKNSNINSSSSSNNGSNSSDMDEEKVVDTSNWIEMRFVDPTLTKESIKVGLEDVYSQMQNLPIIEPESTSKMTDDANNSNSNDYEEKRSLNLSKIKIGDLVEPGKQYENTRNASKSKRGSRSAESTTVVIDDIKKHIFGNRSFIKLNDKLALSRQEFIDGFECWQALPDPNINNIESMGVQSVNPFLQACLQPVTTTKKLSKIAGLNGYTPSRQDWLDTKSSRPLGTPAEVLKTAKNVENFLQQHIEVKDQSFTINDNSIKDNIVGDNNAGDKNTQDGTIVKLDNTAAAAPTHTAGKGAVQRIGDKVVGDNSKVFNKGPGGVHFT